jgi:predicted small integral membrane protein
VTGVEWMVWTGPTAAVFIGLGVLLATLTVWARISPPVARRGFLRMETDRGDRTYIGLISAAVFLVGWIAFTHLSMWLGLAFALVLALAIGIWG